MIFIFTNHVANAFATSWF